MSENVYALVLLVILLVQVPLIYGYLPIIAMHGIGGSRHDFDPLIATIEKHHPGTTLYPLASIWYSLPWQLRMLNSRIEELKYQKNFTQHHLLCHSQGALLCRAYVEEYSHNVESFLSLAGPQMGQFGATKYWEDYVPFLRNMTTHEAWKILYTPEIQMYISVAGYWNDPFHHTSFMRGCAFLPRFTYFNSDRHKYNFLRLKKAIFLGSRDDEVIEPYQSTLFGYWNITEKQDNYTIVPMEEQYMFKHNFFGLKTMRDRGKLFVHEHEGVWHVDWLSREDLFLKYMARHLY